jgi:hypothetical protein
MSEMSCSIARTMGELPHSDKGNFPVARKLPVGYFPHMAQKTLDAFVRGLKLITDAEGVKMKPLSEAAGMSETGVKDLIRYGSSPKVANAYALARQLGRTVDEIIATGLSGEVSAPSASPSIAVAGRVGAGANVDLFDAYEKGDGLYRVTCPPQLSPRGMVAVEVDGDSMAPIFTSGTVLFYSRETLGVPVEAIGHICVCEDEGGKAWVKVVKTGSQEGTFSLISVNPEAENMHGVRLKWAARVRFSLPPDLVERVG